jgi:hypothetical protein
MLSLLAMRVRPGRPSALGPVLPEAVPTETLALTARCSKARRMAGFAGEAKNAMLARVPMTA